MGRKKKQPVLLFDGTKDVTEKDIARQQYERLMAEQALWNITKDQKVNLFARIIAMLTN